MIGLQNHLRILVLPQTYCPESFVGGPGNVYFWLLWDDADKQNPTKAAKQLRVSFISEICKKRSQRAVSLACLYLVSVPHSDARPPQNNPRSM